MHRFLPALGLLLLLSLFAQGQSLPDLSITASFNERSLPEIFTELESSHQVRFYYREEELPAKKYSLSFDNTTLDRVLTQLLEGTSLGQLYYRDFAVIIASKEMILEVYTANYYQALEQNLNAAQKEDQQIVIGEISQLKPSGRALVRGTILDEQTNEPVIGATVFWPELEMGTSTDSEGNFEAELPTGAHEMLIQYVGYSDWQRTVSVYSDGSIAIPLRKGAVDLEEVIVEARAADANVENVQIGVERLDVEQIKKLPTFLGETDVVKTLLLHPGVSSVGEGSTGFNVRGGDVDQNLILQDEGFIFNASHALGFFSTFNTDLISNVDLYKGNIPAQYGGRIASVLDVQMRDGDFERFRLKGGVGLVSSRISLEGPVIKEKASFIAGFRSSYSDWILKRINVEEVKRSSAFFYDANFRYTHRLNQKNTIILSAYSSEDEFTYNEAFGFDYSTLLGQVTYKNIFSDQAFNNLSLTASRYESRQTDLDSIDASHFTNSIDYIKLKEHFTYQPNETLKLDAGLSSIFYLVEPGERRPGNDISRITPKKLEKERGLESALFLNTEYTVSPAFLVSAGLRFALYQFLGPKTVFEYANDSNPNEGDITGTTEYGSGEVISSYTSLEPRLSMRYRFTAETSVKAGYSRTAQFINQIFNSDSPTPTSQFQLSTGYIAPFRSHNLSVGIFQNFEDNNWETSIEGYGRIMDELYDYKDFAKLIVNDHLETELLSGKGRAYGAELSVKKNRGQVNGWMSYTLSRSERQIEGINKNDWYPSNFDKTHDLSIIFNYQPNQRHTFTLNFNYSTGRPNTPPLANYTTVEGLAIPIYAERNQVRIPDYHRLDFSYTIGKGYKTTNKFKTSWTLSIYNVYGRRNAFSVFYTQGPFSSAQANKLSILGSAFPAITFNLESI